MFEFATKDGKLDHVVNTAGDSLGLVDIKDVTAENIYKMATVRYTGMLLMTKLAPDYMPSDE